MITLEEQLLASIKISGGIKRIQLRSKEQFLLIQFREIKIALASLLEKGEIIEIEYKANGAKEFFYLGGPTEIKIRGKGI